MLAPATLLLHSALALAAPPALLGGGGAVWLGPLPPSPGGAEVLVRPDDRGLHLAVPLKDGGQWTWTPDGEAPGDLVEGHVLEQDDAGRPVRLQLPGGALVRLVWRDATTLRGIYGPGAARLELEPAHGSGDLVMTDSLGRRQSLRQQVMADGRTLLELQGGAGQIVRSAFDTGGRLVAWTDPRGLQGTVTWSEGRASIITGGGIPWTVDLDDNGVVTAIVDPLGHRWRYTVDGEGRLLDVLTPAGTSSRWKRDADGHAILIEDNEGRWALLRDGQGRLRTLQRGGGVSVQVLRDAGGQLSALEDGAGGTVAFELDSAGRISVLQTRAGGRWEIERGSRGQVRQVRAPTGELWQVERDSMGRVRTLIGPGGDRMGLLRGASGEVTRVTAPDGRHTGIVRDAWGRVRAVRPTGGRQLTIGRGPAGEVSSVLIDGVRVQILRDAHGRPLAAGPVSWQYDSAGRVDALATPTVSLELARDPNGWLTAVGTGDGDWRLAVQRDALGRALAWTGTDGEVRVERDADGRVRAESGPAGRVTLVRDARGLVDRIESLRGAWKWMRDASGAVLRVIGPDGPALGVGRDESGRAVLERLPGGSMLLRTLSPASVETRVQGSADQTLLAHAWSPDVSGMPRWSEILGEPRQTWRTDGFGRLIGVEGTDQRAWSMLPGSTQGPDGELFLTDRFGRLQEARLHTSVPAWGVAVDGLAVHRDALGRTETIAGDQGQARLKYDALSRLTEVNLGGSRWTVRWDARGRPGLVEWPAGEGHGLLWSPAPTDVGPAPLLAHGPGLMRALLPSPRGPLGWSTLDGGVGALARPGLDAPVLAVHGAEALERRMLPAGQGAGLADASVVGARRIELFGGGPTLGGDGRCLDPIAGQNLDGSLAWPWASSGDSERSVLDPAGWAPESPWHDPVGMLVAMGQIAAPWIDAGLAMPRVDPAVEWLPPSLDASVDPLDVNVLPVGSLSMVDPADEAIVMAVLEHLIHDGGPLPASILPGGFIGPIDVGGLPPGADVLGTAPWDERTVDPWSPRFSLARWGPSP